MRQVSVEVARVRTHFVTHGFGNSLTSSRQRTQSYAVSSGLLAVANQVEHTVLLLIPRAAANSRKWSLA